MANTLTQPCLILLFLVALVSLGVFLSGPTTYSQGDEVKLWSNKIGPYNNPSESYSYSDSQFKGIFCQPEGEVKAKDQSLGELLEGDTKAEYTVFKLPYAVTRSNIQACSLKLTEEHVKTLKELIKRNFFYEFVYDDIAIYGFVGFVVPESEGVRETYYIYTHFQFMLFANIQEKTLIFANLTNDMASAVPLKTGELPISYSARWFNVNVPSSERFRVYRNNFFPYSLEDTEIHWISIMNSIILVILLTFVVATILYGVLKNDYQRYDKKDLSHSPEEDYGWKEVHADVFRFPSHVNLFSAMIGVGIQFVSLSVFILLLALYGVYKPGNDGSLILSALVLYALTSAISGFVSASWYKKLEGENWVRNVILTASIFSVPFFIVAGIVNGISASYSVTLALPFLTILKVLAIWVFVGLPLTLIGAVAGKRLTGDFDPPIVPRKSKRELPALPFYRKLPLTMAFAGFLPFSAIFTEIHYVFSSLWGHAVYQLWGILCIVFAVLVVVTACTTITLTFVHVSSEDWRWWWHSFLWGGSTGFWMLLYSAFYFYPRTNMDGVVQIVFYFGYQLTLCYIFFLSLGSVGFLSSMYFLRYIYSNLHTD